MFYFCFALLIFACSPSEILETHREKQHNNTNYKLIVNEKEHLSKLGENVSIEKAVNNDDSTINDSSDSPKMDTLNYENWDSNELYDWISSIKDHKTRELMFADYSLINLKLACFFLFFWDHSVQKKKLHLETAFNTPCSTADDLTQLKTHKAKNKYQENTHTQKIKQQQQPAI